MSASSDNGRAGRRQRPAVRPEGADPCGATAGATGRRRPDSGMGCWVRTAAARGGPDPARPARGRHPGDRRGEPAASGRQCVPAGSGGPAGRHAGPAPRHAAAAGRPATRRARRSRPAGVARGAPLLAAAGGLVLVLAFPGYDLPALAPSSARRRWRSPCAAGASGPACGSGWSSGWPSSCRCCPGPASTSGPLPWLALAVWRGAAPGAARRRHRARPPGCRCGRSGPPPSGSPTRRCAAGSSSAASRGGGSGSARPRARCSPSPPTAACRWSASPSR